MQTIFGILCIAVGAFGMTVYPAMEKIISTDEKIAMLFGFVMIVFGFIIIYGDRKKRNSRDQRNKKIDYRLQLS